MILYEKVPTRVFVVEYARNKEDEKQLGIAVVNNVNTDYEEFTLIDKHGFVISNSSTSFAIWKPKTWLGCFNTNL